MPEPKRITPNTGAIYSADLMYEQNCKCGLTEVVMQEESFLWTSKGDYGWKMVALEDDTIIETIAITNISVVDCAKLCTVTYKAGQEIMGNIEAFACMGGGWIVYKDCKLS